MALERWNPFQSDEDSRSERSPVRNLQRDMNRVFDDFFQGPALAPRRSQSTSLRDGRFRPRLEVNEDEEELAVAAELPGMNADDVEIEATESALRLKGEKTSEWSEEDDGVVRSERSYGYFERTLPLPDRVDLESAQATFEDGVLNIRLPKTGSADAERLEIESD